MSDIKVFLTNLGAKRLVSLLSLSVVLTWLAFYHRLVEFAVEIGVPEDAIDRGDAAVSLISFKTLSFGVGIFLMAGIATFFVQVATTKPLRRTVALAVWAGIVVLLILASKPDA